MRPPTLFDTRAAVDLSKRQIAADIASGRVPANVATFSQLHDFVDANEYGGLCQAGTVWATGGGLNPESSDAANEVQGQVDAWIRSGMTDDA